MYLYVSYIVGNVCQTSNLYKQHDLSLHLPIDTTECLIESPEEVAHLFTPNDAILTSRGSWMSLANIPKWMNFFACTDMHRSPKHSNNKPNETITSIITSGSKFLLKTYLNLHFVLPKVHRGILKSIVIHRRFPSSPSPCPSPNLSRAKHPEDVCNSCEPCSRCPYLAPHAKSEC